MKTLKDKKTLWILLTLAVITGMLSAGVAVSQAAPLGDGIVCNNGTTFDLVADDGFVVTPDGNSVYMWGYRIDGGKFQLPGPTLCVEAGQTITVNLENMLTEPVSIVFPGQSDVTTTGGLATPGLFTTEAGAGGGTVTYTFTATEPGTYLYESGTNTHKQIQMGLYGGLIVRPQGHSNWAYNDPATEFDPAREYFLLMSEVDPDLHNAVERGLPYNATTRHDRYWFINGRAATDTLAANGVAWLPNQPYGALVRIEAGAELSAMIRYANAGSYNHPFHPHGNTMTVVGRDGRPLGDASFENFTSTIGSGQTYDLMFRWDNVEGFDPNGPTIPENSRFPFPNLGNLVFKDDATWYSGDEYLGVQGDFPPGVTSFNECGEFYFPWHSHALNEVQNWNEGFGGMLTLVRVDPPGGCQ